VHSRKENGEWTTRVAISGDRVAVESLGADLLVDQIYRASAIT